MDPLATSRSPSSGFETEAPLAGRRRSGHFVHHVDVSRRLVGWTNQDQACLEETRDLVLLELDAIVDALYQGLLVQSEFATQFADLEGTASAERITSSLSTLRRWLHLVVEAPLDRAAVGALASVAHGYVRPRDPDDTRMEARYVLVTLARFQTLVVELLARHIADAEKLALCVAAWCKRLMIHLDLFLAVYGSTESRAHWY